MQSKSPEPPGPASVEPEITFIVTYPCPRCQAALEARTGASSGWLRCPRCGRASLPPEHMRTAPPARPRPQDEEVLVIGPEPKDHHRTRAGRSPLGAYPGGARRIGLGTALFLASIMLVSSLLDRNGFNAMTFGIATLVCLGLLMFPNRPGRKQ